MLLNNKLVEQCNYKMQDAQRHYSRTKNQIAAVKERIVQTAIMNEGSNQDLLDELKDLQFDLDFYPKQFQQAKNELLKHVESLELMDF